MNFISKTVLSVLAILIAVSCSQKEKIVRINGNTMGTTYTVKIADDVPDAQKIKAEIDSLLADVNKKMSTYIANSEISRFNKFNDTAWFPVSSDFLEVLIIAVNISKLSGGYYDITVGPLVNLWGFGPSPKKEIIPSQKEIDSVKRFTGIDLIAIREKPPAIKKKRTGVYIDLSSIAKGYGVDKVSEFLSAKGFVNTLVEIGGELRARGTKADGSPWLVGVENPNKKGIATAVKLINRSIATSGDYMNYFEYEGKRYSHTINPKTGRPVTHNLASVSVVAKNCALADAYATAIDVMGPNNGYTFAAKNNLPVYMIIRSGNKFKVKMNAGFRKLLK